MARGDKRSPEELDQEWSELIEEHRLAMPGTQVLFAFLLVLPFQQRFEELSENQVYVYFSALLCAAIAIVLLITPTANHRLRWRQGDKEALLEDANRLAIAATVFRSGLTCALKNRRTLAGSLSIIRASSALDSPAASRFSSS